MDCKVSENFISLALNPKSGSFMIFGNYLTYGILGSILMDLAIGNKINISDRRILVNQDSGISGIRTHDRMMELLSKSSRPVKISNWLRKLSFTAGWYRREMMKMLVDNGRLKRVGKRFLFIPCNLHYVSDISRYKKLILRFKDIILYGKKPDEAEIMTLGLIFACKLHRVLATESTERQKVRRSLKKLIRDNPVASDVNKTIMEMQAAITESITATVAAGGGPR
ncbi:MAG TPA: GPP34 family phosphoprotein [Bacteroidales bacterium]|nr:GPP34 family phosphoprotein [Bacteroidales bacterium]